MAVFSNHLMYNTHPFPITGVIVVMILCVISAYNRSHCGHDLMCYQCQ